MSTTDNAQNGGNTHQTRVRVIVVNYNGGIHLKRCIDALLAQTLQDFEAVLVDNASTDTSLEDISSDPRLRIEKLDTNVGFAVANNLAAHTAHTPYLAFLNPDAIAEPNWLETLIEAADAAPSFQLFGSLQLQDGRPDVIDGAGDAYYFAGTAWRQSQGKSTASLNQGPYEVFGACAAAALVRTDWFSKLGGFDESYFCYFEDVDMAFRLRLCGGHVLQVNDAVVHHVGSASSGIESDFVVYHANRNQIWTFMKCMPLAMAVALTPAFASVLVFKYAKALRNKKGDIMIRAIRDAVSDRKRIYAHRKTLQSTRTASVSDIARAMTWSLQGRLKQR